VLFGALMVGGAAVVVWRDVRRARDGVQGRVLAGMLAESVVMAVVCALVVGAGHRAAPPRAPGAATVAPALAAPALAASDGGLDAMGAPARLMIALGAGLYEELLFRVVSSARCSSSPAERSASPRPARARLAVVLGALIFSPSTTFGPYGEPFTLAAFGFRAIAGLFFSALYVLRGFGIAAWTHALYDVGVLML
jgi:hypothetical protein